MLVIFLENCNTETFRKEMRTNAIALDPQNLGYFLTSTHLYQLQKKILFLTEIHAMKILILNGPNLNLLGTREPEIYGHTSMVDVIELLEAEFKETEFLLFQSNWEGEIIDRIQKDDFDALIINPGAFTHYSYAIADCLKNLQKQKIEVHISNIYNREEFRQKSVTAAYTNGLISGFGTQGYRLAVLSLLSN